jgi:hypothetical protein
MDQEVIMRTTRSLACLLLVLVAGCGRLAPAPTAAPSPEPLPSPTLQPTASAFVPPLEPVTVTIDDFEAPETDWAAGMEPEYPDSSALGVALTGEHASQGVQALQLSFEKTDKPKAIFYLARQLDLSQTPFLQFDVFNPGAAASLTVAVTTGPDRVWYESNNFNLPAGQLSRVVFDLSAGDYKAASTNWEFRTSIADLNDVHRLAIIVFPAESGEVYLDNVLLTDSPPYR